MGELKPIAVIGTELPTTGRVVELVMVLTRPDGTHRVEGAECRPASGPNLLGHGATLRHGTFRVLATRVGEGGRIEALLPWNLAALVPAASAGDGVYLADEVEAWERAEEADERGYVARWKAGEV